MSAGAALVANHGYVEVWERQYLRDLSCLRGYWIYLTNMLATCEGAVEDLAAKNCVAWRTLKTLAVCLMQVWQPALARYGRESLHDLVY